jgi:hypothetical protein
VRVGKATFLLGAGLGFILGSRAGRGPYQEIESKIREITHRPQVQDRLHQLHDTAQDQAAVADKAAPSQSPSEHGGVVVPEPSQESYVDPQDLQFSTAAARKEDMVDELLDQGVSPSELEGKEDELRQSGAIIEPRAGNTARPVEDA